MDCEKYISFRALAIALLLLFYGIYFIKMFLQNRKGIRTHQIGTKKAGRRNLIECIMSAATLGVVAAELYSVLLDRHELIPDGVRFVGFCIGLAGNILFLISVVAMGDSWRAGIPSEDKTEFVSNGIYRFSRNPAFLGFDSMYIGLLIMFFNLEMLFFTIFAVAALHLQILQEEKYLTERFGDRYISYKKQVCRYIGRKKC